MTLLIDNPELFGLEGVRIRNHLDFFNGTFLESFDALVTSDGATVTMTLEQSGGGNLTMVFSDKLITLDCTPAATIALTPGIDAIPQENYIYIPQSTKVLTKSTSDWPSAEHIRIAYFLVPSASLVNTGAPGNNYALINHNINDHAQGTNGQGHLSHITARSRRERARWHSGCEGVATQDGNDLWVSVATGLVFQMHPHTFPALDSDTAGAGDKILVINDPDAAYTLINSLNSITKLSSGVAIGNNKHVKFILWGVANKGGEVSLMMLNLPSDEYNTAANAATDVQGYANFTIPAEFALESSTGFLIAAFVCKHTATAMEIQSTIDLRGQDSVNAVGSGTGGGDVTASAVLADDAITTGDGGAKGIQSSSASIADDGVVSILGLGTGGYTDYDLKVGDPSSYGMIQMGNAAIGRTSFKAGAMDLDGTVLCRNIGGPVTGDIEFLWAESTGGTTRFAIPKSGVGLATYCSRSELFVGPAPADTNSVKLTYWQNLGHFPNLLCDTDGFGADVGVQHFLEVGDTIFVDKIEESTAAAGVTVDGVNIGTHAANANAHHNQSHTVASHSDTTATGVELETLTDGSNADSLHVHTGQTIRIPIIHFGAQPDSSGDVSFEPYSIKATNNVWKRSVGIFNKTATRIGLHGGFAIPKNYAGTLAKIIVVWTSTVTSGDVEWDFDYRAVGGNDSESLDQAGTQETVNANDTAPGAIHRRMEIALTLTHGNFAVDDEVEFTLFRDGTDGGNTMNAAAIVFGVYFEYEN